MSIDSVRCINFLFFFIVKHAMAISLKVGVRNLLFKFFAHTLVVVGAI